MHGCRHGDVNDRRHDTRERLPQFSVGVRKGAQQVGDGCLQPLRLGEPRRPMLFGGVSEEQLVQVDATVFRLLAHTPDHRQEKRHDRLDERCVRALE